MTNRPRTLQVPASWPTPQTHRATYAEALKAAELEYRTAQMALHSDDSNEARARYALALATMIARLLAERSIPRAAAVYIGDRSEDGESADANGLAFIAATWGYGSLQPAHMAPHWRAASSPQALAATLMCT